MDWTSFAIGLGAGLGIGVIGIFVAIRRTTLSLTNVLIDGASELIRKANS